MQEYGASAAATYPWAQYEPQLATASHISLNARKRKGSGFTVLQKVMEQDTGMSIRAKRILRDMIGNDSIEEEAIDETHLLATTQLATQTPPPSLEAINPNALKSDEEVLKMAQEGRLSLLGSIVRVVRESIATPVTTKQIVETCVLAVQPGSLPSEMDAKDMILAALVFLSSSHENEYWKLPLIRPVEELADLEKRSYELVASPTDSQLQWLETAFLSSTDKYLPREKYCPRLEKYDEDPLLLKGIIPAIAMPNTAAAKRKATLAAKAAAAASPTPESQGGYS